MVPRTIAAARLVPMLGSALDVSPAYRGLADAIRLLVADGRLPAGTRLPSERDLGTALHLSRTTVTRAYAELRDRGYLQSRQGSGSVVTVPGDPSGRRQSNALDPGPARWDSLDEAADGIRAHHGTGAQDGPDTRDPSVIDLTCASSTAPAGTMAAYERALALLPRHLAGTGYHPLGLTQLREALAQRFTDRGMPTTADQIMVTSGALAGLAVAARALLAPGDRIALENPTYPNAIDTLRRSGARLVPVPLERGGWDVDGLAAALRQTAPRAAYLIPDFQNPTGALMSSDQRAAVAAALGSTRTVAIVDETLTDLAHDPGLTMPRPLGAYHSRTVTLGGSSKSFWGGLRIGWVRAPRDLMPALVSARLTLDLGAPVFEQLVLSELLANRAEIVRERRESTVATRDALVAAVERLLPQWRFRLPAGGLCLWVELPEPLSTPLCAAADRQGLVLAPGSQFGVEGGFERFLRLPFAGYPAAVMTDAVERLAVAWQEALDARPARAGRSPLVA